MMPAPASHEAFSVAPYPVTTRFLTPVANAFALQTLPDGIVSVIGTVCARAHELKDIKARESLATPLHVAPKSVTMFFATDVGAETGGRGGGDDFGLAWAVACSKATVIIAGTSDSAIFSVVLCIVGTVSLNPQPRIVSI